MIRFEGTRFPCPCCGYLTLEEPSPGSYSICPICFWEDDIIQFEDPDYVDGANHVSLRTAQANFIEFGVSELRFQQYVRKPARDDGRDPTWKPVR